MKQRQNSNGYFSLMVSASLVFHKTSRTMRRARKHRYWTSVLFGWIILAGCETRKPVVTTAEASPVTSVSTALDTMLTGQPMLPDTTISSGNQPSETGDIAALHEPFEEIKQLAPGLRLIIRSIRPAATAVIRDPSDLKVVLSIERNRTIIYQDTTADGWTYEMYAMPETKKLYPLWVPASGSNGELLVAFSNRPSKELARRFHIRNDHVASIDTLLTFDGPAKDWDRDGKLEYAGFYDFGEEWDDDEGQHRRMYIPTLYYEVRPTGLVLDSALTERKARADYGVFWGFKDSGQPGILISKLPKGSKYRR